jgi:hypothetical protein
MGQKILNHNCILLKKYYTKSMFCIETYYEFFESILREAAQSKRVKLYLQSISTTTTGNVSFPPHSPYKIFFVLPHVY